ncbi:MAG: peptidoglycan-binding protein [Clostridia bacterium]|nr:peptidoglycan-binding protein [Clostridia bacterium]
MKKLTALLLALALLASAAAFGETEAVPMDDNSADAEAQPMDNLDDDGFEELTVDARDLKYGDEGEDVAELQQRLTDLYYYTGKISGNYREGTRAAVKEFQQDFGLEVTGDADTETIALLFATMYRPRQYQSSGDDVKRMQTRLTELGYYHGKISGSYLEGTRSAINQFQQKNGLEPTGLADVDTQYALYDAKAIGKNDGVSLTPAPKATAAPHDPSDPVEVMDVPYTKRLARGSSGKLVKQVQQRLTDLGYYSGPVSGNYLSKTINAVKTFQKQNGLEDTGICSEATWDLLFNTAELVMPQDTPKPTPVPTPVPYTVVVDVNNQITTVYGLDDNGNYTKVVREMICSTGTKKYPSDLGEFVTNGRRANWCYFPTWGGHARYWTRINSSIAFHSVCYTAVDTMAMNVSSYKALGRRASHGCIRLLVADAKWVYDNIGKGTTILITEDLPDDPELKASVQAPPLNTKSMTPYETPVPTAAPEYIPGKLPPLPLTDLRKGDSSEAVYWMQCRLKELGYYTGKCSGTYLNGTVNAVKEFQKANGLKVNGTANVKTLELLYADVLATPTPEVIPTPAPTEGV